MRETFGRYVDPRVVEGLIDRQSQTATDGQRRVMTVLFCDMKGFTSLSEGMTPQGLVKVMNHYLSTMSGPIRSHRGIIDKYIGDAIMAYWGPPFTEDGEQARLACLAAIDMAERGAALRTELPELLGVRTVPSDCDVRIGIATGEVLVGSIGSEFMMSYTVMGDAVNLASRLEGANKIYGSHSLVSEPTIAAAGDAIEFREIDRLVVVGQTHPEAVFEIMGRKGELTPRSSWRCGSDIPKDSPPIARSVGTRRVGLSSAALEVVPGDGPSHGAGQAHRGFPGQSAGRRLGRRMASRSEMIGPGCAYAARNSSTISQYLLRRLFEHRMRGARDHLGARPLHVCRQRMQHLRQRALGVGAADEQRRRLDRFRVRLGERRALVAGLADQRRGVVAQQLLRRRRQPLPGAGTFQRIDEDLRGRRRYRPWRSPRRKPRSARPAARGRACSRDRAWRRVRRRARPGSACATDQAAAGRRETRYARRGNGPSGRPARYRAAR